MTLIYIIHVSMHKWNDIKKNADGKLTVFIFIIFLFPFRSWKSFFVFRGVNELFPLVYFWLKNELTSDGREKHFPQTAAKNYQLAARIDLFLNTCFDVRTVNTNSKVMNLFLASRCSPNEAKHDRNTPSVLFGVRGILANIKEL